MVTQNVREESHSKIKTQANSVITQPDDNGRTSMYNQTTTLNVKEMYHSTRW
jgi:hypothetical protein